MTACAAEGARILLVEDDHKLADLVSEYLRANGFEVVVEHRGDRAEATLHGEEPDLVILDILLPGKDGRAVCRDVRQTYDGPIMMLTALGEDADQIVGLEMGADDYLVKPVRPRLLLSRIHALLRRVRGEGEHATGAPSVPGPGECVSLHGLVVDPGNRTVSLDGEPVPLSTAEFDLLYFLVSHPGQVLDRDRIYRAVRGIGYDGVDRSIDLRIARLRRKLGDDARCPRLIKSIHGEGYLLARES